MTDLIDSLESVRSDRGGLSAVCVVRYPAEAKLVILASHLSPVNRTARSLTAHPLDFLS